MNRQMGSAILNPVVRRKPCFISRARCRLFAPGIRDFGCMASASLRREMMNRNHDDGKVLRRLQLELHRACRRSDEIRSEAECSYQQLGIGEMALADHHPANHCVFLRRGSAFPAVIIFQTRAPVHDTGIRCHRLESGQAPK